MTIEQTKINKAICFLLLLLCTVNSTAQNNPDWSKVYDDKYYISYENSTKSVILYARRDTMIEVWIDGQKDMADYTQDKTISSYESWDNGVAISINPRADGTLGVHSRFCVGSGTDFQYIPPVEPITFGQITFYDCTSFKENINFFANLDPFQLLMFSNTAYHLYKMDKPKCNDCAIAILEEVTKAAPTMSIPFLNLADAYWSADNIDKALENYIKYTNLMNQNNLNDKIPSRVAKRLTTKITTNED